MPTPPAIASRSESAISKLSPAASELISGGFFVFDKRIFDYLDEDCILEQEPLEQLAKDKQLAVYEHRGFWFCMDTYRDYLELNKMWDENRATWKIWKD